MKLFAFHYYAKFVLLEVQEALVDDNLGKL